jgi:MFS family permease
MPDTGAIEQQSVVRTLLPILAVVFIGFLVIGLAMPVLPLHVHETLGFGAFVVGLVSGSQFTASLLSRLWAGHFADTRGANRAVIIGVLIATFSGLVYLLSFYLARAPVASVTTLIVGRGFLGAAESFIITGSLGWGMALCGRPNTGKVISWVGMAMYAAFAIGAPLGTLLYARYGFVAVALATIFLPILALAVVLSSRAVVPITTTARPRFNTVAAAVMLPGIGLAFSSVGFGAITTFISLLFVKQNWGPVWQAFTVLSVAFILCRVFFGHLPDKLGGANVALIFVIIEAIGQSLIWLAPSPPLALTGVGLTGFGYSLVFPGYGLEAVHSVPAENRALAMGAYTAFLDLALGISGPALGLVASAYNFRSVFLISTMLVLCSAGVAIALLFTNRKTVRAQP